MQLEKFVRKNLKTLAHACYLAAEWQLTSAEAHAGINADAAAGRYERSARRFIRLRDELRARAKTRTATTRRRRAA